MKDTHELAKGTRRNTVFSLQISRRFDPKGNVDYLGNHQKDTRNGSGQASPGNDGDYFCAADSRPEKIRRHIWPQNGTTILPVQDEQWCAGHIITTAQSECSRTGGDAVSIWWPVDRPLCAAPEWLADSQVPPAGLGPTTERGRYVSFLRLAGMCPFFAECMGLQQRGSCREISSRDSPRQTRYWSKDSSYRLREECKGGAAFTWRGHPKNNFYRPAQMTWGNFLKNLVWIGFYYLKGTDLAACYSLVYLSRWTNATIREVTAQPEWPFRRTKDNSLRAPMGLD